MGITKKKKKWHNKNDMANRIEARGDNNYDVWWIEMIRIGQARFASAPTKKEKESTIQDSLNFASEIGQFWCSPHKS